MAGGRAPHTDDGGWILDPPGMLFVYEQGAFPMDTVQEDGRFRVAAFRADPRAVLPLDGIRVPRTLRRTLPGRGYAVTIDTAFERVVGACADRPGLDRSERWLTPRLQEAYRALHAWGHARSFEVWDGDELVGGTFGVALGRLHTLESMFHTRTDAGTAAVLWAARSIREAGYAVLDVQQRTQHTARLGVVEIRESLFHARVRAALRDGLRPLPLPAEPRRRDAAAVVAA